MGREVPGRPVVLRAHGFHGKVVPGLLVYARCRVDYASLCPWSGTMAIGAYFAGSLSRSVLQSTFILFHWIKGSPDENTQGEYNSLTFWEQLDAGVPWTYNKKFLTLVPTLL